MENLPTAAQEQTKPKYQNFEDLPDDEFTVAREAVDSAIVDTACVLLFLQWQRDQSNDRYKPRSPAPMLKVQGDLPEGKFKELEEMYQVFCAGVEYSRGLVQDLWDSIRP